jgi:acetolactate synthase small subunit
MKTYTVEVKKSYGTLERTIGPFTSRALAEQTALAIANGNTSHITIVESGLSKKELFRKVLPKEITASFLKLIKKQG